MHEKANETKSKSQNLSKEESRKKKRKGLGSKVFKRGKKQE
jgi:hypothetical protein